MLKFVVRQAPGTTFGSEPPMGVQIAVSPSHPEVGPTGVDPGGLYVLTPALATDGEIDSAIDQRIKELQEVRLQAKRMLADRKAQTLRAES